MTDLKFAKYVLFFPKTCVNCQKKGGGENYLGKGCTLMYILGIHMEFLLPFTTV